MRLQHKTIYTLLFVLSHFFISAQVVFSDDFESFSVNDNLLDNGYELLYHKDYIGSIVATVGEESGNKFAACLASENGLAQMQFMRALNVEASSAFSFSVSTRGQFKRKLKVLDVKSSEIIAESDDFIPEESQKDQWIEQSLSFELGAGLTEIAIVVYHNWSGKLDIDNIVLNIQGDGRYYISSSLGSDSNDGSIESPWETISKVNSLKLEPGNKVLFKKGDTFKGRLKIKDSGTEDKPIVISSYGEGEKPVLTGQVGGEGGGDYQEAIYVLNSDNLVFTDLEINNERLIARNGVNDKDAYGIYIFNNGTESMENFVFRDLVLRNIYAVQPMTNPDDFNGLKVAGISFFTQKNKVKGEEKNIRNVLVEDCYFTDIQRLGVHMRHQGGNAGIGNDIINRNQDFVFRNNEFHHLGGTCILPTMTYNCLIENNIFNHPGSDADPRMPNRGSSVWNWRSINTVIQYNQCLHIRGYLDSHGIHVDHENVDTFVQYNYMEDCEGGFVEILGGNHNAVYRFNVSVNDGWRANPNWTNSNHTIWLNQNGPGDVVEPSENSYIYNNTVVINSGFKTAIDMNSKNTHIYNNIFYSIDGSEMGSKQVAIKNNGTELYMSNNLYYGKIDDRFKDYDDNPVNGNPYFNQENSGNKLGYQLLEGSAAIDAGVAKQGPPVPNAGIGIFENVEEYPSVDFYGNTVDFVNGKLNAGACNAKNGELGISGLENKLKMSVYPNPVSDTLYIENIKEGTEVKIYNVHGQEVLKESYSGSLKLKGLGSGVYFVACESYTSEKIYIQK